MKLTAEYLRSRLTYHPETGVFVWKPLALRHPDAAKWNGRRAGSPAGSAARHGYVVLCLDGKRYYAHRLAWYLVHGTWPQEIDHIDRNRSNNTITNLRASTRRENSRNLSRKRRKNNTSGVRGVTWDKKNSRWIAAITVDRKRIMLGRFATKEKAAEAYALAAYEHFGKWSDVTAWPEFPFP